MNNYEKWLIVSDIDGTLNNKKMQLPPNNKDAINRFVSNGGIFTLCSGRNLESLSIHYKKLGIRTPAIFLNGAGIYDFKNEEIIHFNPISNDAEKILLDIVKKHKSVQLTVFGANKIYLATRKCLYGYIISKFDKLNFEICNRYSDLPSGNWGKVSLCGLPFVLKKIEKFIKNDVNSKIFESFFTSPITLEIVMAGINKGEAVRELTNILNIDTQNVCAIGDYYNDLPMLKSVSHPACCGQAPDDIKEVCEYVTCHCDDGAVCDFINYIEKNYIL